MSNRELSLANAIAHGEYMGFSISYHCENCGHRYFHIIEISEKIGNHFEDVIIERSYYLKCARCGSEEADKTMTIVPSWSGPCIDRDKLPKWEMDDGKTTIE